MSEHPSGSDEPGRQVDNTDYVGSPTEFADVDEVPEWVATATKVLFFLPSAVITATSIPLIFLALVVVMCACVIMAGSLLSAI